MQIHEVMTKRVRTVPADESVELAKWALKFWSHRHLPVVDPDGHVVGMLTPSDLLEAIGERDGMAPITVAEAMHRPVHTIPQDAAIERALPRMREAGIHALPVVDAADRLVGIVTDADVLAATIERPRGMD